MDVEDRFIELLGDLAEGGIFRNTGIREHNTELALLQLDLCEQAIKIAKVVHVSLYARYISSDLLDRRCQLRVTARRYEDVRAFAHKLPRRRKANAAIAARNEGNFSFKLAHLEASSVRSSLAQLFSASVARHIEPTFSTTSQYAPNQVHKHVCQPSAISTNPLTR